MPRLIVDLETDNLLEDCTKVHCLAITDVDSDYSELFVNDGNGRIGQAIDQLLLPDTTIIGHNFFMFDNEVFKKLYDIDFTKTHVVHDTMVMSQCLYGNLDQMDYDTFHISKKFIGKHSLAAWGQRMKCEKIEYQGGFSKYTDEMGTYCLKDTEVTKRAYLFLESQIESRTWK